MGYGTRAISPTVWTIGSSYKPSSSMVKKILLYRFTYVIYGADDHHQSSTRSTKRCLEYSWRLPVVPVPMLVLPVDHWRLHVPLVPVPVLVRSVHTPLPQVQSSLSTQAPGPPAVFLFLTVVRYEYHTGTILLMPNMHTKHTMTITFAGQGMIRPLPLIMPKNRTYLHNRFTLRLGVWGPRPRQRCYPTVVGAGCLPTS